MALKLDDKKVIVQEVSQVANNAVSLVAAEYIGINVADMTELRKSSRNQGVYLKVVRNTLARRALQGTEFECASEKLVGPIILGFSESEPGKAARILRDFAKDNEKCKVKLICLSGELLGPESLDKVASLPTKDEALARFAAALIAPVTKLVRTMVEPYAKLVRTVAAVRDLKQQQ